MRWAAGFSAVENGYSMELAVLRSAAEKVEAAVKLGVYGAGEGSGLNTTTPAEFQIATMSRRS